ncbi:MAG: tRNA preQ1(34) S-adenosylmethionine ribosyltransferase-isomerase QueA [Planctomycetes bacterium]|nr:tRNA preQ1(34) S-adenosylmethionine ribosyltransferase-isomerase QueA [Planctomycetota bacterium]
MQDFDRLSTYDYALPEHLIAKVPLPTRDASRLLVITRQNGQISHKSIRDLPDLLAPKDCLVLNNTRVLPARLVGHRVATGGKWEGLYLGSDDHGRWKLIGQTRGYLQQGESVAVTASSGEQLQLQLKSREADGVFVFTPDQCGSAVETLRRFGTLPLPPYFDRKTADANDWERYQTVFATSPGSVAAPTAGLHFTPELLERCHQRGISRTEVTLHVGLGTFRPVTVENIAEHQMHSEWCEISSQAVADLTATRAAGGRIVSVGTTSLRTLESAAAVQAAWQPWQGETQIFIRPPYTFRAVDALVTNFHLPKSTLLMLVSAFAGVDLIRAAYREAIAQEYRFFSYGDAMLIL